MCTNSFVRLSFKDHSDSEGLHPLASLLKLREEARASYNSRHLSSHSQPSALELALRLSGDKSLLDNTRSMTLAEPPAFQEAHPAIIAYLDEFGQSSGTDTPVEGEIPA